MVNLAFILILACNVWDGCAYSSLMQLKFNNQQECIQYKKDITANKTSYIIIQDCYEIRDDKY